MKLDCKGPPRSGLVQHDDLRLRLRLRPNLAIVMIFAIGKTLGSKITPNAKFANHGNVRRNWLQGYAIQGINWQ
ncbi:MAG: hypothetical protein APF76_13600 [Desulfitibacter sp. BRH_c19]|nr:MAG: hypothetical protein APF76_13600 [Desulfitibacter sp. BRH_c19]